LSGDVPRASDMDGLERLGASFDIQANSVDNRVGTGHGKGRGRFVPNICVDGLELSAVSESSGEGCALGVADGNADPCSLVDETFDDVAAQKSGPAEDRDKLVSHKLLDPTLRTRTSARHARSWKVYHPRASARPPLLCGTQQFHPLELAVHRAPTNQTRIGISRRLPRG